MKTHTHIVCLGLFGLSHFAGAQYQLNSIKEPCSERSAFESKVFKSDDEAGKSCGAMPVKSSGSDSIGSKCNTLVDYYERLCDRPSLDYWQRKAYDYGFQDGYECGVNRNDYKAEIDRIAYEIGFIDGCDMYDRTNGVIKIR
jgi:hypothetical protein